MEYAQVRIRRLLHKHPTCTILQVARLLFFSEDTVVKWKLSTRTIIRYKPNLFVLNNEGVRVPVSTCNIAPQ